MPPFNLSSQQTPLTARSVRCLFASSVTGRGLASSSRTSGSEGRTQELAYPDPNPDSDPHPDPDPEPDPSLTQVLTLTQTLTLILILTLTLTLT